MECVPAAVSWDAENVEWGQIFIRGKTVTDKDLTPEIIN